MVRWTRLVCLALIVSGTPAIVSAQSIPSGLQYFGEPVALPRQPGTVVVAMAVGDVTGDSMDDVITAEKPNRIVVHKGDGAGTFVEQVSNVGFEPYGDAVRLEVIDADGDGDKDLLMLDGKTTTADGYISVWPNPGDGWFANAAVGAQVTGVLWDRTYAIVDLDSDGRQELPILGTDFGGRLYRYYPGIPAVDQDYTFGHVWRYLGGAAVYGNVSLAIGGFHLLGGLAYQNPNSSVFQNCAPDRTLVGFRPLPTNMFFRACGAYSGSGGLITPNVSTVSPRFTTAGIGATNALTSTITYALVPASGLPGGGNGWQVLIYSPQAAAIGGIGNGFSLYGGGAHYYAGNTADATATVNVDGAGFGEFIIAGINGVRYVGLSTSAAPQSGTGTINTLNAQPARTFGARLGRTATRDDLVIHANGYALVYFDNGNAPTITVSAPNVVAPAGYNATGQTIALPAAIDLSASGGVGPFTYRVYSGTTLGSGSSPVTVHLPAGGSYTAMAIDSEGMWSTATGTITVGTPPVLPPLGVSIGSPGPFASDDFGSASVTVTATPVDAQGAVTYQWSVDGGGSIATGNVAAWTASLFIGQHPVQVTVTDAWGRTASATTTVQVRITASAGTTGATGRLSLRCCDDTSTR